MQANRQRLLKASARALCAVLAGLTVALGGVDPGSCAERTREASRQDTLRAGDDAPSFVMAELASGEPVFLSDFTGTTLRQPWKKAARQVVVLCFWSSWSEPSEVQIARLSEMAARVRDDPVRFFLVNTLERPGSTRESLSAVVRDRGYTIPVLVDATGTVADRYGVATLPVTAVVDKQGVLRMLHRGPDSDAGGRLEALVKDLAQQP